MYGIDSYTPDMAQPEASSAVLESQDWWGRARGNCVPMAGQRVHEYMSDIVSVLLEPIMGFGGR